MSEILIGLVGDVLVDRDKPKKVFDEVRRVLLEPDVLFGNLEGVYTNSPRPVPNAFSVVSARAHNLDAFIDAGFDVMSMANNHVLDVGYDAMFETRARLRENGIETCGAGNNLADARRPAIVEAGGRRIAFLAYASVFPLGYEARSGTAGLAPMRAHNFYRDTFPGVHLPGKLPSVSTVPDEGDLRRLTEDIENARKMADVVITSFHWGEMTRPYTLTDHEIRTARFCVDQGVDLVVGHHHHALRGIEWYRGKPIFYGLGHFVFDLILPWSDAYEGDLAELLPETFAQGPYVSGPRKGWPFLPMHEDTRMTMLAWARLNGAGVGDIGFLPCKIGPDGLVRPLHIGGEESNAVVRYLEEGIRVQHLNGQITEADAPVIGGYKSLRVIPK